MGAKEARQRTSSIKVVWPFFIAINNSANRVPVLRLVEPVYDRVTTTAEIFLVKNRVENPLFGRHTLDIKGPEPPVVPKSKHVD